MSKKGNCSAGFEIAHLHGGRFRELLVSFPCSSIDKAEMRRRSRKWAGIMGMRKKIKRKHMESRGLGGGMCGRDRIF